MEPAEPQSECAISKCSRGCHKIGIAPIDDMQCPNVRWKTPRERGEGGGAPKRVATYGGRRRGGCTRGQAAGDAAEGRVLQGKAFLTRIKSGDNRGSTATGVSASAGEKDARSSFSSCCLE